MPSIIRKESYGSVTVFWLNRDLLKQEVAKAAQRTAAENSEVHRIVLFGSVATGAAVPTSDVDLLIIVSHSRDRYLDRPMRYQPYFEEIGMATDLFVYTAEEVESETVPLIRTALSQGEILFEREWRPL